MNKFKKIFTSQKEAKKYGLNDIELYFDKNIEFPYYGLPIAEKISHDGIYEYVSYFKEDNKKTDFKDTLAYKLLINPNVVTPFTTEQKTDEDENLIIVEKYNLLYFNKNSSVLKPTVLYNYNPKQTYENKIGCEYLFVFDNEWIFPYEEIICVANEDEFGVELAPIDYICDVLNDIKKMRTNTNHLFYDCPACNIYQADDGTETVELEVCNLKGEYRTLKFSTNDFSKVANSLCSVRFVEVEEKEKGTNKYQKKQKELYMD